MKRKHTRSFRSVCLGTMVFIVGFSMRPSYANASPAAIVLQNTTGAYLYEKLEKKRKEYEEAIATRDSSLIAEMGYQLGKVFIGVGDQLAAQRLFMQSLRIWAPRRRWESMSKVYLRLAECQIRLKREPEAFQYAQLALQHAKRGGSNHNLMSANVVMSGAYLLRYEINKDERDADSSTYYFQRAEKLALFLGVPYDIANLYSIYAASQTGIDKRRSLSYLKKANAIFTKEKFTYAVINSSLGLGSSYLDLRQTIHAKKWLSRARYVMDTSKFGDFEQKGRLLEASARLSEQLSDYKQALTHYRNYHHLAVQAANADREGAVSRLAIEYETEKKAALVATQRKELSLRTKNLETQRRLTWLSLALGLSALVCGGVFYWLYQKYRRVSDQNALLVAEQNHRVKNNLQQITSLLSLQTNRVTDPVAKRTLEESLLRIHAVSLVHQRLYDGKQPIHVDLNEYLPRLTAGILRIFGLESLQPQYLVEKIWLHADKAASLGLIVNEVITNACKYAFPTQQDPALTISCIREEKKIVIEMVDNGLGFNAGSVTKGFGLQVIDVLVRRLKGQAFTDQNGSRFKLVFEP